LEQNHKTNNLEQNHKTLKIESTGVQIFPLIVQNLAGSEVLDLLRVSLTNLMDDSDPQSIYLSKITFQGDHLIDAS